MRREVAMSSRWRTMTTRLTSAHLFLWRAHHERCDRYRHREMRGERRAFGAGLGCGEFREHRLRRWRATWQRASAPIRWPMHERWPAISSRNDRRPSVPPSGCARLALRPPADVLPAERTRAPSTGQIDPSEVGGIGQRSPSSLNRALLQNSSNIAETRFEISASCARNATFAAWASSGPSSGCGPRVSNSPRRSTSPSRTA